MSSATHIFVTCPEGRLAPVHKDDGIEPGGGVMYVRPGEVRRVRYWLEDGRTSQTTRRAVGRGDLVLCNMDGAPVDSYEAAAAPDELPDNRRPVAPDRKTRKDTHK